MHIRTGSYSSSTVRVAVLLAMTGTLLAACGGGGSDNAPAPNLSIGGTVSGLTGGSLVLRNNGANDLTVTANGGFTFSNQIASGASYSVTVGTNPTTPAQTCTVANGSGTASASVTSVAVTCTTNTYTLGGNLSGLGTGKSLVLTNGTANLTVNANGNFTFPSAIPSGTTFNVVVSTQPAGQTCSVTNGGGTIGAAAVTNLVVACSTNSYTVSGTINGLLGSGLVLQNNSGNDQTPAAGATSFAFPAVAGSSPYAVAVATQPVNPSQACSVVNGSGTGTGGNVTNVAVNCVTNSFPVNVTVTGLAGGSVVLRNNGGNNLTVNANGTSAFTTLVQSGSNYSVAVLTQPTSPTQVCTPSGATGTMGNGPVTVTVTCSTQTYSISGTITGLTGTGMQIRNNGGDTQTLAANATSFSFPTQVASGAAYAVTVSTQPASPVQNCTVANASGTVGSGNVGNVAITCTTTGFAVGGTVTGLIGGSTLVLRNNGGNDKSITANGAFNFTTNVPDGGAYAVTVQTQPATSPGRTCEVISGGTGTVSGAAVSTVRVVCRSKFALVTNKLGDARVTALTLGANGVPTETSFQTVQSQFDDGNPLTTTDPVADAWGVATTPSGGHVFVSVDEENPTGAPPDTTGEQTPGVIRVFQMSSAGVLSAATETVVPAVNSPNEPSQPRRILVHPNGTVVYVVDSANGAVVYGTFDAPNSTLTFPNFGWVQVFGLSGVALDPTGKWLYTGSYDNSEVLAQEISNDGSLVTRAQTDIGTTQGSVALAIDPSGRYVFVSNRGDRWIGAYAINQTNGALTLIGSQLSSDDGVNLEYVELVVDPTGQFLFAARNDGAVVVYSVNQTTGAIAKLTTHISATAPTIGTEFHIALDTSGQYLYQTSLNNGTVTVFRVNATTGALTEMVGSPVSMSEGGTDGIFIP
jgi:6-phosphogluconolactonase (cycloisomerase 2 family)